MHAPAELQTDRLLLRKPVLADANEIFRRYAADTAVGKYLAWPIHQTIDDTHAFIEFSDSEWSSSPAGPYLIHARQDGLLLGSTGLSFETPERASTGYVIAADTWGNGYATEAVGAMQALATKLGVERLFACCHPDHQPSRHVLEKSGFELEGTLRRYAEFPNLAPGQSLDAVCYAWLPQLAGSAEKCK